MREILFRGRRLDNCEWVEGSLIKVSIKGQTAYLIFGDNFAFDGKKVKALKHACVDPTTVGQYTGMNIYGKKIFEGDILKLDHIGPGRGVQGVAEVVFKYGKLCMPWGHRKELVPLDGFANTTMEVIGNIHDNPELLEGGK